jgi:hypothetical protein
MLRLDVLAAYQPRQECTTAGASGKRAAVCVKMQKEDALSTSLVPSSPT